MLACRISGLWDEWDNFLALATRWQKAKTTGLAFTNAFSLSSRYAKRQL
jgi:hypothetical protein